MTSEWKYTLQNHMEMFDKVERYEFYKMLFEK